MAMRFLAKRDLKKYRLETGLSQDAVASILAEALNKSFSQAFYGLVERGENTVDLKTARAIAELFSLPISNLFKSTHESIKFGNQL